MEAPGHGLLCLAIASILHRRRDNPETDPKKKWWDIGSKMWQGWGIFPDIRDIRKATSEILSNSLEIQSSLQKWPSNVQCQSDRLREVRRQRVLTLNVQNTYQRKINLIKKTMSDEKNKAWTITSNGFLGNGRNYLCSQTNYTFL